MDEIDWIKSIKKVLILFFKIFGGFAIVVGGISLVATPINDWEIKGLYLFVSLLIAIVPPLVLSLCYGVIVLIGRILNSGRTVITFDKGYIRDLPKHCSPAICSLIYDLKIDVYKDYTATLLYLCIKKYIELIKNVEGYKLRVLNEKDYSNLGRCEKYVLDIILGKNTFDENKFKEEIIKEAQEKELITNKKYSKRYKLVLIWIVAIILLIVTKLINKNIFYLLVTIFVTIAYFSIEGLFLYSTVNIEYKRTRDGKNIAILLKGLKRYIKEYTLIKDKEIDYVQILENYIPYALSLGEADIVEEFIKYNEEYRDLIYNRKTMK